jgi:hypothetical protein
MADDSKRAERQASDSAESEARSDRGLSDRVRRAMAVGLGVASRSKDDLVRAATSEIGSWLNRLDVQGELAKVLATMVVEVKAEIRFRPREDGTVAPEITSDIHVKPPAKP